MSIGFAAGENGPTADARLARVREDIHKILSEVAVSDSSHSQMARDLLGSLDLGKDSRVQETPSVQDAAADDNFAVVKESQRDINIREPDVMASNPVDMHPIGIDPTMSSRASTVLDFLIQRSGTAIPLATIENVVLPLGFGLSKQESKVAMTNVLSEITKSGFSRRVQTWTDTSTGRKMISFVDASESDSDSPEIAGSTAAASKKQNPKKGNTRKVPCMPAGSSQNIANAESDKAAYGIDESGDPDFLELIGDDVDEIFAEAGISDTEFADVEIVPSSRGRKQRTRKKSKKQIELEQAILEAFAGTMLESEAVRMAGLCAQTDPEAFFPDKGGSTRDAKKVCADCPISARCLASAILKEERFGIWGGYSERERKKLMKSPEELQKRLLFMLALNAQQNRAQGPSHTPSNPHPSLEKAFLAQQ